MLTVGLTGGIGSGKTTISDLFSNLGVPIIDTDLISHQLLELGRHGYEKVIGHFGDKLLDKDLRIDRRRLRRIVFDDEVEKHWLEATLHPLIHGGRGGTGRQCLPASGDEATGGPGLPRRQFYYRHRTAE